MHCIQGPFLLVAEPAAEPEVEDLTLATPASETPPEAVSDEELSPPADGEETPEAEDTTEEPAPRLPDSYSQQELDELYRTGQLTDPALVERREQFAQRAAQSARDRAAAEQSQLQERLARKAEQEQEFRDAFIKRSTALDLGADRLAEGADPAMVKESNARALADYDSKIKEIILAEVHDALDKGYIAVYGDSAQTRDWLANMDIATKAGNVHQTGQDFLAGKLRAAVAQQQRDAEAAAKKAKDDEKAKNAPPSTPKLNGAKGGAGRNLTVAQIDAMPMNEWEALGDDETRQKILDDAHAREARR